MRVRLPRGCNVARKQDDPARLQAPELGPQLAGEFGSVESEGKQLAGEGAQDGDVHHPAREQHLLLHEQVRRGEGIGSALLRHRLDAVRGAAYLESSKQENIPLYERFGFELRDPIRVPDGPELWPMWRKG